MRDARIRDAQPSICVASGLELRFRRARASQPGDHGRASSLRWNSYVKIAGKCECRKRTRATVVATAISRLRFRSCSTSTRSSRARCLAVLACRPCVRCNARSRSAGARALTRWAPISWCATDGPSHPAVLQLLVALVHLASAMRIGSSPLNLYESQRDSPCSTFAWIGGAQVSPHRSALCNAGPNARRQVHMDRRV